MNLLPQQVAEIRAAEGVYRASDVARAYEVHPSTVTRIWAGTVRADIRPAPEPPNISTRTRPSDYSEDIRLMAGRGMTMKEIASSLGISVRSAYLYRGVFV